MPYHPGLLPSRLQRASWFRHLASSHPNFLHSERSARWRCKLFPLTVLQIKDLPRWWTRWTNGLYIGPTQEKNYFAPGGNWTRINQLRVRRSTSRPQVAPRTYIFLLEQISPQLCYCLKKTLWFVYNPSNKNNWHNLKNNHLVYFIKF